MRKSLDGIGIYFTELAAQMDKQENRDVAETFIRKLGVLQNFVGSHQKKLNTKEDDMEVTGVNLEEDIDILPNETPEERQIRLEKYPVGDG